VEDLAREDDIKFITERDNADIQYNGRLSPLAKEEIYRHY
jgi:hypothetical protein